MRELTFGPATLSILLSTLHLAQALTDVFMVCEEPLPSDSAGWPPGYSAYQYLDNIDLCSGLNGNTFNGHSKNVGCLCPSDEADLWCSTQYGDTNFYIPPFGTGAVMANGQAWSDFCRARCRCTTEEVADGYRAHDALGEAVFSSSYPANMYNFVMPYGMDGDEDDAESSGSNDVDANELGALNAVNHTTLPNGLGPLNAGNHASICSYPPLACNGSSSCNLSGGSACQCRITGSQFLRADVVKHFTACGMQTPKSRRRNDGAANEMPCVCNSTYVSHKCCKAGSEGLVWEPADAKLGEVMLLEDL